MDTLSLLFTFKISFREELDCLTYREKKAPFVKQLLNTT